MFDIFNKRILNVGNIIENEETKNHSVVLEEGERIVGVALENENGIVYSL